MEVSPFVILKMGQTKRQEQYGQLKLFVAAYVLGIEIHPKYEGVVYSCFLINCNPMRRLHFSS